MNVMLGVRTLDQNIAYCAMLTRIQAWIPGLGVKIDYAAIVEILIQQLDDQPDRGYYFDRAFSVTLLIPPVRR